MEVEFEWDEEKDAMNTLKHGISFEEAKMVFFDPLRLEFFDWDHSIGEERWKVFGFVGWVPLMVSCAIKDKIIRIISARQATKREEEVYFNGYNSKNSN